MKDTKIGFISVAAHLDFKPNSKLINSLSYRINSITKRLLFTFQENRDVHPPTYVDLTALLCLLCIA